MSINKTDSIFHALGIRGFVVIALLVLIVVSGSPHSGIYFWRNYLSILSLYTFAYMFTFLFSVAVVAMSLPLIPREPSAPAARRSKDPGKPMLLYNLGRWVSVFIVLLIILLFQQPFKSLTLSFPIWLSIWWWDLDLGIYFAMVLSVFILAVFIMRVMRKIEQKLLLPFTTQGALWALWMFLGWSSILLTMELLIIDAGVGVVVGLGSIVVAWFFRSKLLPRAPSIPT